MFNPLTTKLQLLSLPILLVSVNLGKVSANPSVNPSNSRYALKTKTIVLGQPCQNAYVVAIPTKDFRILDQVQHHISTAFLTQGEFGFYIQVGSYPDRLAAEQLYHQLRPQGFDVRVMYRPLHC